MQWRSIGRPKSIGLDMEKIHSKQDMYDRAARRHIDRGIIIVQRSNLQMGQRGNEKNVHIIRHSGLSVPNIS